MKKLILKELREHFKVAAIGLAVLTLILFQTFTVSSTQLQQAAFGGQSQSDALQPLLASTVLAGVSFFCAIFGTLLGYLQIHAERHPDLWAFLVHRPIARTKILQSKILAGLILYALGAALPLLGLVIVARIPGNVAAPFEWAMALPLLAIFFVGIVYYFAGLLTGLRRARWYASRGFGLGPAILASVSVFIFGEFWQALIVIIVAAVLLAAAVWGSFQTGGHYRNQPLPGKLSLTAACTAAVVVLLAMLFIQAEALLSSRGYIYSRYQMTKDGNIYKVTQHGFDDSEIVDLSGKPLLDEKTGKKIKPAEFG